MELFEISCGEKTKPIKAKCPAFGRMSEAGRRWMTGMLDDRRLNIRQSSLILTCFGPAFSDGREAKNIQNICQIKELGQFSSKKGCIFRSVRIQYIISEAFFGRPIKMSYSRNVGLLEVSDYGRNVLFLTGSRRKTQSE